MKLERIRWRPRAEPLIAQGMLIRRAQRSAAIKKLLSLSDNSLQQLRGSANESVILLLGEADLLPWIPGVAYVGKDPRAAHLWMPTTLEPILPIDLLERAFRRAYGEQNLVINPWDKKCYGINESLSLVRSTLEALT